MDAIIHSVPVAMLAVLCVASKEANYVVKKSKKISGAVATYKRFIVSSKKYRPGTLYYNVVSVPGSASKTEWIRINKVDNGMIHYTVVPTEYRLQSGVGWVSLPSMEDGDRQAVKVTDVEDDPGMLLDYKMFMPDMDFVINDAAQQMAKEQVYCQQFANAIRL